jgi:hypothetical protein
MHLVEKEPAQQEAMMASMDFADVGMNMAALIQGVVRANLRAMQELSRVKNPQGLAELQHRFAAEYIAALQHGTMNLMNALRSDARRI